MSLESASTISKNPLKKKIDVGLSIKKLAWIVCCLTLILLAVACGGGGGIGDLAGGGTGGTGISVGPATSFGSVEVNGTHFSTEDAEIFVEGQSKGIGDQALMDNIALGMIVRVDGDIDSSQDNVAYQVHFNDDIRGPIDSIREIDTLTTELVVLGQEILITDITQSADVEAAALVLGEWVTASGFKDAAGRLMASYIAVTTNAAGANIKGTVTQLNRTDKQFEINGMRVGYQAANFVGLTSLSEGLQAEVTGMLSDDQGTIIAERIEPVDRFGTTDSDRIELTGVILEATDTQLVLDSVRVNLNAQTEYIGGEQQDLDSGVRVEVEGKLDSGVLIAEEVTFLDNAKVESDVISNQENQSGLKLTSLSDITILYNEVTKVTGAADTAEEITEDTDNKYHVKIIGRQTSDSTMLAIHIIVKSGLNSTVKLQGPLEIKNARDEEITILGHVVDLSTIADENFESPEGVSVDRTYFLDSIDTGDLISVKGEQTDYIVTWQSATAE